MTQLRVLPRRLRADPSTRRARSRGQTLVEFGLVFPLFFVLMMGIVEFAFAFNAILSVTYASRNAALLAAEAGRVGGADCVVLASIERDVSAPASPTRIDRVQIYRATANGTQYDSTSVTTYVRDDPVDCTMPDLSVVQVPYTRTGNGYPEDQRCNILAGCPGHSSTVDYIGVRIFYEHDYVTPLRTFVGTGDGFDFDRTNVMRMEPIL